MCAPKFWALGSSHGDLKQELEKHRHANARPSSARGLPSLWMQRREEGPNSRQNEVRLGRDRGGWRSRPPSASQPLIGCRRACQCSDVALSLFGRLLSSFFAAAALLACHPLSPGRFVSPRRLDGGAVLVRHLDLHPWDLEELHTIVPHTAAPLSLAPCKKHPLPRT